jgi:hypothetical protein
VPDFSSFVTLGLVLAMAGSPAVRCGLNEAAAWWVAALVATMPAVYVGAHGCFVDGILQLALAHQLDVTHVLGVKSEVGNFQVTPGTAELTLVFQAGNQRVYRMNDRAWCRTTGLPRLG